MEVEPKPGAWLPPIDFEQVVRLTPLVAIDLVVRLEDGRVLLGRRKNEPARGFLFVPGSRVTKNESLAAAFERIAEEELGLKWELARARLLGVYEHVYQTNRFEKPGFGTHYVVLAHEIILKSQPLSLPVDQHGEYIWLTPAELLAHREVHEYTKAYFRARKEG
jgi:colanic acid biosynthesis protein WcaH